MKETLPHYYERTTKRKWFLSNYDQLRWIFMLRKDDSVYTEHRGVGGEWQLGEALFNCFFDSVLLRLVSGL